MILKVGDDPRALPPEFEGTHHRLHVEHSYNGGHLTECYASFPPVPVGSPSSWLSTHCMIVFWRQKTDPDAQATGQGLARPNAAIPQAPTSPECPPSKSTLLPQARSLRYYLARSNCSSGGRTCHGCSPWRFSESSFFNLGFVAKEVN